MSSAIRDAARYAVLRRYIEPRTLYDKLVRAGKIVGAWRDIPTDQSIGEKIDELCDAAVTVGEHPECSICRREHGPEITHECE